MLKLRGLVALFVCAVLIPGAASSQAVRDSAGIRIVVHARNAAAPATWRLAPQPVVEIGGADVTGPAMFSHIWGMARAATGEIVVSDEPTQELRVFDRTGKHLRTLGGRGQGPGEFSQIRGVAVRGDTIRPIDTERTTAFTLSGRVIRAVPYPPMTPYRPIDPWGVLADGSVILTGAGGESRELQMQRGRRTEMRGLVRVAPDGRSQTLLGIVPTYEHFNDEKGATGIAYAPFGTVAVLDDRVCIAHSSAYEIKCMNRDGKLEMIIRRDIAPVPITPAAREAFVQRIRTPIRGADLAGHEPVPQSRLDDLAARTHFPANMPAFGRIKGGARGEVWVSEYRPQDQTRPRGEPAPAHETVQWDVFGATGAWMASVSIPARFTPHEFGTDYILGVNRDDDDVPRVTMYRLQR